MAEFAGTKVGEWFAFYVLDKMIDKVFSYFSGRCDVLKGAEDMLRDLQDRLPRIRAAIDAAEGMPIRDQELAKWIADLKDAAYMADDVVDEFEFKELHDRLHPRRRLQLIGQEISRKLHGLPLAGKVLGSLLQSEQEEGYWRSISESEWWKQELRILPSLGLSYQHLNTNLKQCFAYTCIFPRGFQFDKEQLVHMWIAQGFIQFDSDQRTRPEDSGNRMFDQLTNRYFFFPTMYNKFVLHDLIRDLAVYVSLDECYVVSEWPVKFPAIVRHLTLNTDNLDVLRDVPKFQKLPTIIFFRDYDSSELHGILEGILKNLKSLRVLDLSRSGIQIKKLPDAICDLSHLRYLDISCTGIRQLPKQFSRLCHLQVLNLQRCIFKKMPTFRSWKNSASQGREGTGSES